MSSSPKSCKNTYWFYVNNNDHIRSQFCTCHDSWAVMPCAKVLPDCTIRNKLRAKLIATSFQIWAHKLIVTLTPSCYVMLVCLSSCTMEIHHDLTLHLSHLLALINLSSCFVRKYETTHMGLVVVYGCGALKQVRFYHKLMSVLVYDCWLSKMTRFDYNF